MAARPLYKTDVEARLKERVARLERADQERARHLAQTRLALIAAQKDAAEQRQLRQAAEANSRRFHALLLQERVRNTIRKDNP